MDGVFRNKVEERCMDVFLNHLRIVQGYTITSFEQGGKKSRQYKQLSDDHSVIAAMRVITIS